MRLLIKLRCVESCKYEMQHHYHVQGFVYNLLKGSKYSFIHNKEGYKFFCFSNIFPATKCLEKNDLRTLIISSPNSEFILHLYEILKQPWNQSAQIKIGHMKFRIDSLDNLIVNIRNNSPISLITGTPIIVRIPRVKYKSYGIEPSGKYDYVYWRIEHPVDLFISQVEDNLLKKYNQYHKNNEDIAENIRQFPIVQSFSLFQKFKFKKQISTRVFMKGFDQVIIGTVWEFGFNEDIDKNIIQFALDSGLGERNSLGFGFMNVIT